MPYSQEQEEMEVAHAPKPGLSCGDSVNAREVKLQNRLERSWGRLTHGSEGIQKTALTAP